MNRAYTWPDISRRNFLARTLTLGGSILLNPILSRQAIALPQGKKYLLLYYSWSGHTRSLAERLGQKTGGDVLELKLARPYSTNYNRCVEAFKDERNTGSDRELTTRLPDLVPYDVVFIGYPIWGGNIPTPHRYPAATQ